MTTVSSASDITLVSLLNCPSDFTFCRDVFTRIAQLGVVVDMISLAPNHGSAMAISFTIQDDDLPQVLTFLAKLKETRSIKAIISSGNCKINVYDEKMKDTPGMAAKVFTAAAAAGAGIRIITTSDVGISILVAYADFDRTLAAVEEACR